MNSAPARNILGLSAYYPDSAAALLQDGELVAAAQQERFSRKKHDAGFPADAVSYCLDAAGIQLTDVDRIVFYDKPLITFERTKEKRRSRMRLVMLCEKEWREINLFASAKCGQFIL